MEHPAHNPVQLLRLAQVQQPLPVGRIAHHAAVLALLGKVTDVPNRGGHSPLHPGFSGVCQGELHGGRVDVEPFRLE